MRSAHKDGEDAQGLCTRPSAWIWSWFPWLMSGLIICLSKMSWFSTPSHVISLALGVSLSEDLTDEEAVLSNLYESWPLLESQMPSGNAA